MLALLQAGFVISSSETVFLAQVANGNKKTLSISKNKAIPNR